ncbi:MAG TPA: sensor domain-containing diguanylate cyclase [Micromonospora sp.]|nr:sensor domain-containing diguanylate cyclase [Micromonospora sp.]
MATSAAAACHSVADVLGRHTRAMVAVLLRVHDRLRCMAATGSWHVFSSLPAGTGVIGRVYASGRAEIITDVEKDPDYLPLGPDVAVEICTPITNPSGQPIGVLNLEWAAPIDADRWAVTVGQIADLLGDRIAQLNGPPAESRSEKLLRHAVALTSATSEEELMAEAVDAARDVSGLSAGVFISSGAGGRTAGRPAALPGELESRIFARLADAGPVILAELVSLAHRQGACYTLGESGHPVLPGYDVLVEAGARTLIAVPVGPSPTGGALVVADERLLRPDPTVVNLMELLAAQTWACLDRLHSLAKLHEQAISDPLTGLRHHGPFGERIAAATPDRTALLAIDVDGFKNVNDTYGHEVGDRVLVRLARAMEGALRHGDELYRVGGDEFVAVVEVLRPEEALGVAERLARAARKIGQTISVGVAVQHDGESAKETLRRADTALYEVKRQGRDGVRLAAP